MESSPTSASTGDVCTASPATIPLTQAALRAGKSYLAMRNAILRGEVRGFLDERNRYQVDVHDLERYVATQQIEHSSAEHLAPAMAG